MSQAAIATRIAGGIATVTIDNTVRRNAMTVAMWRALAAAFEGFAGRDDVRVVALEGQGDHFCSGADISEFEEARSTLDKSLDYQRLVDGANQAIRRLEKPVVALIRGSCYGGGVGLAVHCDMRIARDDAAFAIPAGKLGVSYEYQSVEALVDLIGPAATSEIFFTAQPLSAARALDRGLVNAVHDQNHFDRETAQLLERIAGLAPLTLASVKRAITLARERHHGETERARFMESFRACFGSEDYREGRLAFVEKRKPVFRGR